jgi:hypothetical protein
MGDATNNREAASTLASRIIVINPRKDIPMRLQEFIDPSDYTLCADDTASLLEQIERMWPARIGDDDAPAQHRPKKHSPNDRPKPLDAL